MGLSLNRAVCRLGVAAAAAVMLLPLSGCGGSGVDVGVGLSDASNGQLTGQNGAFGQGLAPYEILDLGSGTASTATTVPDLLTNPSYSSSQIVFRRVHGLQTDYFLGVFELTQGQWIRLSGGGTPWSTLDATVVPLPAAGTPTAALPAYNLSFDLISSTLAVYNKTAVVHLDLPTIIQWQFACAAGSDPAFWSWGASRDPAVYRAYANLLPTQMPLTTSTPTGGPEIVGALLPNAFGFYDMQGNVWEWATPGPHICGGSWHDTIDSARTIASAGSDSCIVTTQTTHALIGARLILLP